MWPHKGGGINTFITCHSIHLAQQIGDAVENSLNHIYISCKDDKNHLYYLLLAFSADSRFRLLMAAQKCIFPLILPLPISPGRHKTETISVLQVRNQAKDETSHLFKFQWSESKSCKCYRSIVSTVQSIFWGEKLEFTSVHLCVMKLSFREMEQRGEKVPKARKNSNK